MELWYKGRKILLFTHPHRSYDVYTYHKNHFDMMQWSEEFFVDGMLCSTSSYDYYEPWLWAQHLMENTTRLSPIIAINPIYTHPFTAARLIASLTHFYKRKVWVNYITGSAEADLTQAGDTLSHSERYERLTEFATIVDQLLLARTPVSFQGKYYDIRQATLTLTPDEEHRPGFLLSGESEAALNSCRQLNYPNVVMLNPHRYHDLANTSIAFGIITRETHQEAQDANLSHYPPDRFGKKLLEMSMLTNHTHWKSRLFDELKSGNSDDPVYNLHPFANKYADCPFLVGSYEEIATRILTYCEQGAHSFILTLPHREEFKHILKALDLVKSHSS